METLTAPVESAPSIDFAKSNPFGSLDTKISAPSTPPPPVEKPSEEPKETTPPAPDKEVKAPEDKAVKTKDERTVKDPKWFREQHEKSQTEIKTYAEKVKSLESKIADFESRGKDTTTLTERLATLEKERDDLRGQVRAAKREVSDEFKNQYDKPFTNATAYAKQLIEAFTVTDEQGASRQATFADLQGLYAMPINKAAAAARQMFGEDAGLVMNQLTELHRLEHVRGLALQEEQAKWQERETTEKAENIKREQGFKAMVSSAQKYLAENNPHFKDADGEEGNELRALRQEGYTVFDERPKTIEQAAIKTAEVRHRVAAHGPLVRQLTATRHKMTELEGKLKEAEETIAELRGSAPGKGKRVVPSSGGSGELSWQEELRKNVPAGSEG